MSGLSILQSPFEVALHNYEEQTGINLIDYPLVRELERNNSVKSITALLQEQANPIRKVRGGDSELMESLKRVVNILHILSTAGTFGEGNDLLSLPSKSIFAAFAILIRAVKDVSSSYYVLVVLFHSIKISLRGVDIYMKIPPTPAMTEIVIKIMAELLSTIALATKEIMQGRLEKIMKMLLKDNNVDVILRRLGRLTSDEARATAVQTLEVVLGLVQNMKLVMDDGNASADSIWDALETMQEIASKIYEPQREEVSQHAREWLAPPNPLKNHNNARELHHKGTSTWFVQGNSFAEWKSSGPNSFLWIHGRPGAGKSILCSTIIENIENMRKSGLASLAFFYCDFRDDDKKNLRGLLSSLLVQFCHSSDSYSAILSDFYLEHDNGLRRPSDDALIGCLKRMLQRPGQAPVYIIIDGLDECPNTFSIPSPREKVLEFVEELVNLYLANFHICITSRPEVDIKTHLDSLPFDGISLHDESGQTQDIVNYVNFVVKTDPRMTAWRAADRELAIKVLTTNADRTFRWVFCQIEALRRCFPAYIRQALEGLPESLDGTYERTLQDIDKANWNFARRLFQCVTVASRPLRVEKLAEFLAFDVDAGPTQVALRPEDTINSVVSTCSDFLSIVKVEGSAFIQFSHFSVSEFLTSDRLAQSNDITSRFHVSMTPAHMIMARACLGILLRLDEKRITSDGLEGFPLAEYAAEHWVDHARFGNVSTNPQDDIKCLFDPRRPHLNVLVWIHDPEIRRKTRSERPSQPRGTCLHYAALTGLPELVKSLFSELSPDVNSRNFLNDLTPLHLASRDGYVEVVRVLLGHGADVTTQDVDESTPLHLASGRGHVEIARILLEHNADVNAQDVGRWTALHDASRGGHVEITRLLLKHGADVKAQNQNESTALHLASGCGQMDIARVLLKHGADANAQDVEGWTPLHQASGGGYVEVVRLLLEHGAKASAQQEYEYDVEVNAKDGSSWTPLHLACQEGHLDVVRLLLDCGENPNMKNGDQQTPLSLASSNGGLKVVLFLLEKGANSNSQDRQKRTPLHAASENGHFDIMFLLLNRSADVNAKDAHLWTPLHMASKTGNFTVTLALLNRGAKVDAQDDLGWTPLHIASQDGHREVVRLLLNRQADVNTRHAGGDTALHLAACYGQFQVTQLLLQYGADWHAQNEDGKEPLELALEEGNHEVVELLLEFEAAQAYELRNASQKQPVLITPGTSTSMIYPPPSAAAQGSRSQQESTSQWGGSALSDDSYMGGFMLQGNITPPRVDNRLIAHTSSFPPNTPQVSPPSAQIECRAFFLAVDKNDDGVLSYEELSTALLNYGGFQFSSNTIKYLMRTFDQDCDGAISLEEFGPLWNYMNDWEQMFNSFDADRNGLIDATELSRALAHYHLHVPPHILDMIVKKYGESPDQQPGYGGRPQLNLDHFVRACVTVRQIYYLYERSVRGGQSQMSRDYFLQAIISLP